LNSLLLQTVARVLIPSQLVFSVFLLLRGHNEPGGGFAAGLVAVAAISLQQFALQAGRRRVRLPLDPLSLCGLGLLVAMLAGVIGLISGEPFLTGVWFELDLAVVHLDIGTPLLFDLGVYLLVIGAGNTILQSLVVEQVTR
jgi:multicomponent Na+:H+ antiporter subunit B